MPQRGEGCQHVKGNGGENGEHGKPMRPFGKENVNVVVASHARGGAQMGGNPMQCLPRYCGEPFWCCTRRSGFLSLIRPWDDRDATRPGDSRAGGRRAHITRRTTTACKFNPGYLSVQARGIQPTRGKRRERRIGVRQGRTRKSGSPFLRGCRSCCLKGVGSSRHPSWPRIHIDV